MAISGDTGSEESLSRAREWIEQCMAGHIYCRKNKNAKLPTRLIEVSLPDGSDDVRLHEMQDESGQYACLLKPR
jgi:hypothetical protein